MKRLYWVILGASLVLGFGCHKASADPAFVNGSFEADRIPEHSFTVDLGGPFGDPLTGWTSNAYRFGKRGGLPWGITNLDTGYGPTPYGDQWVALYTGPDSPDRGSYIQQTIPGFTVGKTYNLSFALSSRIEPTGNIVAGFWGLIRPALVE